MQFKEGYGWKACGDKDSDLYNDAVVFLIENGLITEEQDVTTKFVI